MFSQISFLFQIPKREYYDHAQGDFDFGQIHVNWWLSYCQVREKVSVEPCVITGPHYCHFDSLAQDCSNAIAPAMELLQSCTKPLI